MNLDEFNKLDYKLSEHQSIHHLKILKKYFVPIIEKRKLFEIRYNDRNFRLYDIIVLHEIDDVSLDETGRTFVYKIKYISAYQQKHNFLVWSIDYEL